ncbi:MULTISPECIES: sulfotransferase family 2 domain-containing protein [unclassified Ruegeria]|uniref:sulfotransferase family 2 domain-containing protein n=1 Tax=unclassified Ruegeria TaxID=2625375 RepID=UPI001490E03C|nr:MULTISPECIES: sulfotransferase family 2 domain-containing protein [unclassified Ruegeria]NOD36586.1 sulfotransferase family 2 domain-containing protein [Ruegeria sp. HKCCD7296]NOE43826.1 sulfotransferase family 2 domain-containing protein [Ruegeria sp. HKCCD7319]
MILSDSHRFVFIHIPKCAGTTVRTAILPFHEGDDRFHKTVERHPELGLIDFRHMPLRLLAEVDSEAFDKLHTYESFALLRDPFERFRSSLAQRTKMYLGKEYAQLSPNDVRVELERVITYLQSKPRVIAPEFIHFSRQSDFVQLDNSPLVKNLFSVEHLDLFRDALVQHMGADSLKFGHSNRTTVFRYPKLKRVLRNGSAVARRMLPSQAYEKLRKTSRDILMKPSGQKSSFMLDEPKIRDFVESYYADDIVLHRKILLQRTNEQRLQSEVFQ